MKNTAKITKYTKLRFIQTPMKDKRVIITGGLGFIGSDLAKRLVRDNEVTIIDNQSTGNLRNIKFPNNDDLNIIKASITDIDLRTIFPDHDYVFHQAALPSVPRSIKDPKSSNQANITGTLDVIEAASTKWNFNVYYPGADALVVMTGHDEFKGIDLGVVKRVMRTMVVVDGRRVFDEGEVVGIGGLYRGVRNGCVDCSRLNVAKVIRH